MREETMKKFLLMMLIAFMAPFALAHAEEEVVEVPVEDAVVEDYTPESIDPVRAQMETAKESYNDRVRALDAQFQAGEITALEYQDAILAENDALVNQLAPMRAQLSE